MTDTKLTEDGRAFLRDKLQSWPGEMALTSEDISDLLALLDQHKPAPPKVTVTREWAHQRAGLLSTMNFMGAHPEEALRFLKNDNMPGLFACVAKEVLPILESLPGGDK